MLKVKNLHARIGDKEVLKGLNLEIKPGEVHAIMGPNGSGKSTLSKVLAGHPDYEVTSGSVDFEVDFQDRDLLTMAPDERARQGVFLAFQYPIEVPGVSNITFLRAAFNSVCRAQGVKEMGEEDFRKFVEQKAALVDLNPSFLERAVNEGFSGGEKKRNEILQMAVLSPRLAILDETDSGLDIDSLKVVAQGVNKLRNKNNAILLITHYQRLLDYIVPDHVHVLAGGRILQSGDKTLAQKLEQHGYDWLVKAGV
ncbi:MAG: Fe-S cluster assembly ATPase SufC [Bdellovibrionales bacterium]|nr:Fe-S cluster assembly ATPase SufC [Bdellovibrionales bacterium]